MPGFDMDFGQQQKRPYGMPWRPINPGAGFGEFARGLNETASPYVRSGLEGAANAVTNFNRQYVAPAARAGVEGIRQNWGPAVQAAQSVKLPWSMEPKQPGGYSQPMPQVHPQQQSFTQTLAPIGQAVRSMSQLDVSRLPGVPQWNPEASAVSAKEKAPQVPGPSVTPTPASAPAASAPAAPTPASNQVSPAPRLGTAATTAYQAPWTPQGPGWTMPEKPIDVTNYSGVLSSLAMRMEHEGDFAGAAKLFSMAQQVGPGNKLNEAQISALQGKAGLDEAQSALARAQASAVPLESQARMAAAREGIERARVMGPEAKLAAAVKLLGPEGAKRLMYAEGGITGPEVERLMLEGPEKPPITSNNYEQFMRGNPSIWEKFESTWSTGIPELAQEVASSNNPQLQDAFRLYAQKHSQRIPRKMPGWLGGYTAYGPSLLGSMFGTPMSMEELASLR